MHQPTFLIRTSKDGEIYFTLRAVNHEVILTSETYTALGHLQQGIASVRTHSQNDADFDRRLSASDQPYFVLRAANNKVIGTSEMYSSTQKCEQGIAAVKQCAAVAEVVDER
jgi:uncharacterized protein YegP (UPF0339 family)